MSAKNNPAREAQDLRHFLKENASVMFGIDHRIFTTLKHLLFRPGKLTKTFISGDQFFTPPTTLYFTINLLFFLVLPIVNSGNVKLLAFTYKGFTYDNTGFFTELIAKDLEQSGLPEDVYEAQFDSFIKYNQPALIFINIPFFVLLLRLLYLRRATSWLSHIIYAFHFMSFYLISFLGLGVLVNLTIPLLKYIPQSSDIFGLASLMPLLMYTLLLFYYLSKSLYRVYAEAIWMVLLKAAFLNASLIFFLLFYSRILIILSILSIN